MSIQCAHKFTGWCVPHFDGAVTRCRNNVFFIKVDHIDSCSVANQYTPQCDFSRWCHVPHGYRTILIMDDSRTKNINLSLYTQTHWLSALPSNRWPSSHCWIVNAVQLHNDEWVYSPFRRLSRPIHEQLSRSNRWWSLCHRTAGTVPNLCGRSAFSRTSDRYGPILWSYYHASQTQFCDHRTGDNRRPSNFPIDSLFVSTCVDRTASCSRCFRCRSWFSGRVSDKMDAADVCNLDEAWTGTESILVVRQARAIMNQYALYVRLAFSRAFPPILHATIPYILIRQLSVNRNLNTIVYSRRCDRVPFLQNWHKICIRIGGISLL